MGAGAALRRHRWRQRASFADESARRLPKALRVGRNKRRGGAGKPEPPRQSGRLDRRSAGHMLEISHQPFMHSDRVLSASALLMPLVFSLHIAILLFGFSVLAERHVFMNALRSSPFLSAACSLQAFIFSCCGVIASVFFASVLVSAA